MILKKAAADSEGSAQYTDTGRPTWVSEDTNK